MWCLHVCQAHMPRLNASTNQWIVKCVCRFWWTSNANSKVENMHWKHAQINDLLNASIVSSWMSRMHSQINELLTTSAAFDGHPMPIRRLATCTNQWIATYICHFFMDVKRLFQGWVHPQINELLSTLPRLMDIKCQFERWKHSNINKSLNASVMSSQMSRANPKVECIHTSMNS
jgi:hypothetical protein